MPKRWLMKRVVALAALVLAQAAVSAVAADAPGSAAAVASAPTSRGADLLSIISSVSQRTHKKFLVDPRVSATVTLIGTEPHEVTYPLLLTILSVHGFSTYEQDGVIVVVPDANERQVAGGPGATDVVHAADAEVVTVVVAIKNTRANYLVPVLRPLMPQQAQLASVNDHNALIIVDRAANVRRLIAIINDLDKLPILPVQKGE
jgi:general secretion pathway protein D